MDDFQPVSRVEDFFKNEFSWQKNSIIQLPSIIRAYCPDDDKNCLCANLCYVVKKLNAEHFTNYLNTGSPHASRFGNIAICLLGITTNMRDKIPFGKELLFVNNFTKDEKTTVCNNIDSFFSCVAKLGILGLSSNAPEEIKMKETERREEEVKNIQNALLGVFNNYECNG